jgi:hypothetical protein
MTKPLESRSDALKAIRSTREMLKGREDESFHIPPATALFLVYECLDTVEAALSERGLKLPTRAEMLLACGEMTAPEQRAAMAALTWFINRANEA